MAEEKTIEQKAAETILKHPLKSRSAAKLI